MNEMLHVLSNVFTLVFVVGSMLALGLSLTIKQITDPLRNINLVIRALVANFVIVPLLAYLLQWLVPMDASFGTGLLLKRQLPVISLVDRWHSGRRRMRMDWSYRWRWKMRLVGAQLSRWPDYIKLCERIL